MASMQTPIPAKMKIKRVDWLTVAMVYWDEADEEFIDWTSNY